MVMTTPAGMTNPKTLPKGGFRGSDNHSVALPQARLCAPRGWEPAADTQSKRKRRSPHSSVAIIDNPGTAATMTLPGRLELPTLRLTASRSNQLSYGYERKRF